MKTIRLFTIKFAALILNTAVIVGLSACSQSMWSGAANYSQTPVQTYLISSSPTKVPTFTSTPSPSATSKPTLTPTLTPTPTQSPSPSPTLQPTYTILRGEVNVEQVSCFYGPSKAYLYKYLLLGGSNLDIIGFLPDTRYIQVRAIGGNNPCWMNLEWMDVKGDINTVEPIDPIDLLLPASPFYSALTNVSAVRNGDQVTVSWNPLFLRAGDDSLQEPYLVEAWVCQGGRLTFIPVGAYITLANVIDEPGCEESSHGRVYGVEKHGYTRYVVIPWPAFE